MLLLVLTCTAGIHLSAQSTSPQPAVDTTRLIQIIQGKSLREKNIDSVTSLKTIAGNVILREGTTLFYSDSATINSLTHIMEAFGHVHINQNDSIDTYSQYLRYVGTDRVAFLKKEVRLTDKKGTLYTQELQYDLKTSIGIYTTGGRVVNGSSVLTSTEGVYYANTKDVYFKKNVHLVAPKYDIVSDSLLYNTQTQLVTFITATKIKSKTGGDIYTTNGSYDLKDGRAFFGNRSIIKDSTRTYVANDIAYDEKTGIAQLEGNAIIRDSTNGYSILGNQIFSNKNTKAFLATRKPLLIFKGEGKDSTYIAMDTLFSGVERRNINGNTPVKKQTITISKNTDADGAAKKTGAVQKLAPIINWIRPSTDSIIQQFTTVYVLKREEGAEPLVKHLSAEAALTLRADAVIEKIHASELAVKQLPIEPALLQHALNRKPVDSFFVQINRADTLNQNSTLNKENTKKITLPGTPKDTLIRYFEAFHHVRIYNDSTQAVCDSLFYSSEDSVFRLYQKPLLFNNKSQIAGDTIYLFTENKKPKRMYVFENGIIINQANDQMYNQMGGRTINGYFKDGAFDYLRVKGSPAESIYYPQDNDSAYIGMNRSKGDVIDVYFYNRTIQRVKFINDVDGTLYPLRQRPEDQKYLKHFKWWESRRPKNKFELFE